jgi:1,4-dihydroxy-2-naphthoate polyprenyltransferase
MTPQTKNLVKNLIRALRLPFVTASAFPFIFGSFIVGQRIDPVKFSLGLIAVVFAHLSANLINDYADSRSRVDWQDKQFFGFFGGSKLIQEGVFSEQFYLKLTFLCGCISACAVAALAIISKSAFIIPLFVIILFLSWSYSAQPLRFSYRGLGEVGIFILFGPVAVMAGYFLQTGIFPDFKSFFLSLPFGFLTTAILYANEIPDLREDRKAGKRTWAGIVGQGRAYMLYCILMGLAFLSVALNVMAGYLTPAAFLSFPVILIAARAARILKRYPGDKIKLVESSKLTIRVHAITSAILIMVVL